MRPSRLGLTRAAHTLPLASTSSLDLPQWSEPRYVARYRTAQSSDTGSSPGYRAVKRQGTPRSRRLEMERLWSGEAADPLSPECYPPTTSPKHALLFVGSGSQYVSMGEVLKHFPAAEHAWDEAEEALAGFEDWRRSLGLENAPGDVGHLGRMLEEKAPQRARETKLKQVVFDGPQDELTRSSNAQPAILITSIAFLRTLEQEFSTPVSADASYFLGHSSGEYAAAVASSAIDFQTGVRLTRLHGLLTSEALQLPAIGLSDSRTAPSAVRSQMSALIINPGHSHQEVADVVASITSSAMGKEGAVEVASFNSSSQIVLAGSQDGILRAAQVLRELGIASHAADLPVSAPFHCSFMQPAAEGMRIALNQSKIGNPTAPLISGVDGSQITTPSSLVENLVSQISLPVRWSTCLSTLRTAGIDRLMFLGPGKALANLARRDLIQTAKQRASETGVQEEVRTQVVSVATEEDLVRVRQMWRMDGPRESR